MAASAQTEREDERGSTLFPRHRLGASTIHCNSGSDHVSTHEFDFPAMLRFIDGSRELLPVVIRSVTAGIYRVTCDREVAPNSAVSLIVEDTCLSGVTVFCKPVVPGKYRLGIEVSPTGDGRRREVRIPVKISAKMTVAPELSPLGIDITDISGSGCGFIAPIECVTGMPVIIDMGHGMIFGEVRHCRAAKGRFRVGCAIEEYIPLSRDRRKASSGHASYSFWRSAGRYIRRLLKPLAVHASFDSLL